MVKQTYLLPIGSVVRMKGGDKNLMVTGLFPCEKGKRYDYAGVVYPEGYTGSDNLYLMNHEDIDKIIYGGFFDMECVTFFKHLYRLMKEQDKQGKCG